MPSDRADAVVIGAGVEGLAAALNLALAGRQVVCVDARARVEELGRPDEAWISPATARGLGLFQHGLKLGSPAPHVSLSESGWRVLWPDSMRTARTLSPQDADAFLETAAILRRWRAALSEPGAAARAMSSSLDLIRPQDSEIPQIGAFMRSSAAEFLTRRQSDGAINGLLAAMAARRAPAHPDAAASAPMLLGLAPLFDDGGDAARPVAGGQQGLIQALASAFKAAGGVLALDHDVSEIVMDREAVAGLAMGTTAIKAPLAIAAVAPRRLAQGLLNTRRYGRALSGLRGAPRRAQAIAQLTFADAPDLPGRAQGLWGGGVSVWLGATLDALRVAASAMQLRQPAQAPIVELRFSPGLCQAIAVSPYCPGELEAGPWTPQRRDALLAAMLATVKSHWPQAHGLIDSAALIRPRAQQMLGSTGAIFGAVERMPEMDRLFALNGDAPGPLLKGLYLCDPRGFEPDCHAGVSVASAAGGSSPARMRA